MHDDEIPSISDTIFTQWEQRVSVNSVRAIGVTGARYMAMVDQAASTPRFVGWRAGLCLIS